MIDDEGARLMLRFKDGDRGAFESLFQRYTPPLMNFLARMVGDRDRAEELAQEVFVRIYRARERYEAKARFSTWMFGIASNLALNELARAHRQRERPLQEADLAGLANPGPDLDDQVDARKLAQDLHRAMAQLPDRQRAALLLRAEQGLGYDEIGRALNASVASVKSLLHRARESLLTQLKGMEP
jgi:RNA polymerase sigma-70 factor (ECF subfamily)